MRPLSLAVLFAASAIAQDAPAQPGCASAATFTPCDLVFEITEAETSAHSNPYLTVQLHGEFRSPRHRTWRMPGFWDGGRRMVVRFTPTEPGEWNYRISSNLASINGKQGTIAAAESASLGFVRTANVHHWANTANTTPHLWMGDTNYRFAYMERGLFNKIVDTRAEQKFNHIRGLVIRDGEERKAFLTPDQPNVEHFQELDSRILYMNSKGITADLVLASDQNHLVKLMPEREQRERYIRFVVARYAPMNVTWQGVQEFEEYENGRELLKEIGQLLKSLDSYQHPRSTHTVATSSPLLADGWMDYIVYQSSDNDLGSVEHQLYAVPFVNAEFAYEDSGAGKSHPHHVDTDAFRKRLWNTSMNGQYPTFGNTGVYGGRKFEPSAQYLDSPGAQQMTHWFDFFSSTRYWELEPYFDVDGGRALSLPGIEYIVYVEKPSGPVELLVERHGYDVAWFNPITGERIPQKDWKGDRFVAEPPNRTQDWVLHVSREGRKQGMRRYKFESRQILMQEIEQSPQRIPFEVVEPSAGELSAGQDVKYAVKIKRDTRATRSMMYLWTGEVLAGTKGARVLGKGAEGVLRIPQSIVPEGGAVLNVRITALNANGKAYSLDRIYRVKR